MRITVARIRLSRQIALWGTYLPAMVSATILVCQVTNTVIFTSFAYYFGKLYALLDDYMRQTDAMNVSFANSSQYYRYEGVNSERVAQIDSYHEHLWTLVVGEVTVLVFPLVHLLVFAYRMTYRDKMRPRISRKKSKIQAVYLP
ncbi:hypothetical protein AAVH_30690 [Aphelenchoides avenae]|nr:hypothetical protein AAVH_30690 [Aphelenchus avenae]